MSKKKPHATQLIFASSKDRKAQLLIFPSMTFEAGSTVRLSIRVPRGAVPAVSAFGFSWIITKRVEKMQRRTEVTDFEFTTRIAATIVTAIVVSPVPFRCSCDIQPPHLPEEKKL